MAALHIRSDAIAGFLELGNKGIDIGAPVRWDGQRVKGADVDDDLQQVFFLATEKLLAPGDLLDVSPEY